MAGKNTAAFGIYPNRSMVESAVDTLVNSGFRSTDISVLLPDNVGTKEFAHEKNTKAPEGAATGAGTGAVVGGTLGLWPVSARSRFRASDRLSRPDQLWAHSPAPVAEVWLVA